MMGASGRMSSSNLSVISMLLQSVLKPEESSGDILAVLIFQLHLTFAHRQTLYFFFRAALASKELRFKPAKWNIPLVYVYSIVERAKVTVASQATADNPTGLEELKGRFREDRHLIGAGLGSVFSECVLVLYEGLIVHFLEMSYWPIDCNLVNSISRLLSAICCIVDDCMDISHWVQQC